MRLNDPLYGTNISHHFDRNEWRSIDVFRKRAKDFLSIRNGLKLGIITVSMQRHENGTYSGKADTPNDETLLPLYLAFRHFYLEKEPAHFLKVANIIGSTSGDPKLNLFLKKIKAQWKGTLSKDSWLNFRGEPISAKTLLNLWFNAHFFHSDYEKEMELNELNAVLSTEISRHCLFMSVHDASLAISNLYKSIDNLTVSGGRISFPLRLIEKKD